jgi:murein DD-endopeptidase MepM/ murein hydrolase activator NlpD
MDQNFQSQIRTAPDIKPKPTIFQVILTKTIRVEKNLKDRLKGQITTQTVEKKDKKKLKDILKEEDKKKKSTKPKLFQKVKNVTPKTGILDSISNFLVFTFFGWLFTNTQKYLPKLLGIVHVLKGAADGIGWLTRGILDALSAFIGAGYKVYDTIKGKVHDIKSKPIQEKFDSVTKALDDNFSNLLKFFDDINAIAEKSPEKPPSNPSKPDKPKPDKPTVQTPTPKGAANGAYIGPTRGGESVNKPITRSLKTREKPKKPRKVNVPEGNVGRDVGGEKYIREYYGSPKVGIGGIIGIFKPKGAIKRKTPVDTMTTISKTLRGRNNLFGDIASISSDVALGKKPKDDIYKNTAKDVLYLAQLISQGQKSGSNYQAVGMANGGMATSPLQEITDSAETLNMIQMLIKKSIENKINSALNELKNSISTSIKKEEESAPEGGDGGLGTAGGMYGGYTPQSGIQKEIYDYLINVKKLNDNQVLGLMANISRESSFVPSSLSGDDGGPGGLFQWKIPRSTAMEKAVPDWRTNWKGQIDYALREPGEPGPQYMSTQFSSPQKAADWWMKEWERPADEAAASIKHQEYLRTVPRAPNGSVKFRAAERLSDISGLMVEGGRIPSERNITSYRGWRWGRMHRGVDYAGPGIDNEPVSVIKPGVVNYAGWDPGGGGNIVIIDHPDGTSSYYMHLKNGSIPVKNGQKIRPGQVIGIVGNTGTSTATHLHFEVRRGNKDLPDPHKLAPYYFRFGGNVKPTEVQKLAKEKGKEGYINYEDKFIEQKWTPEQRQRFEREQEKRREPNLNRGNPPRGDQVAGQMGQLVDTLRRPTQQPAKPQQQSRPSRPSSLFTTNTKIDPTKGKVLKSTKIDNFGTITIREVDGKRIISLDSYVVKPDFEAYIRSTGNQKLIDAITPPNFFQRLLGGLSQTTPQLPQETQLASNNLESNKIVGMKKGGLVGNPSNIPTGYASYEKPGGATIFVIQEVVDVRMVEKNTPVVMPVPFPVSSGVNNISNNRA